MSQDKVAQLRSLLRDAVHSPHPATTIKTHAHIEALAAPLLVLMQTPRARQQREIMRIANWYSLNTEIIRAMDAACVAAFGDLSDDHLEALHKRMDQLEQCLQHGLDPPDSPVAR